MQKSLNKQQSIMQTQAITNSLETLAQMIRNRLQAHFNNTDTIFPIVKIEDDGSALNAFIVKNQLRLEEYIILLTALVPHVKATFFESIIQEFLPQGGDFSEFG